jgi:hypothetical protein
VPVSPWSCFRGMGRSTAGFPTDAFALQPRRQVCGSAAEVFQTAIIGSSPTSASGTVGANSCTIEPVGELVDTVAVCFNLVSNSFDGFELCFQRVNFRHDSAHPPDLIVCISDCIPGSGGRVSDRLLSSRVQLNHHISVCSQLIL